MHRSNAYVVGPNDSLSSIAAASLGDSSAWSSIADLNSLRPESPLLIGQRLALPPQANRQLPEIWRRAIAQNPNPRLLQRQQPASLLPGYAFQFFIADEYDPFTRRAVRKVLLPPPGVTNLAELERLAHPERYGFSPRDPRSNVSVGRHVGGRVDSRFVSASLSPAGSPRFPGRRFWINLDRAERAGVRVVDAREIVGDLDRVIAKTRDPVQRAKLSAIRNLSLRVDNEILLEGHVPASAVKTRGMMAVTRSAQVLTGVGIIITVYELDQARARSQQQRSIRPLAAETVRQAGGWAGAWVGFKLFGAAGVAVGIETGPGAIVTGLIGGAIGGVAGYTGASWLAEYVEQ